jgi:DHA2 family multidrug resistance protein
MLNDRLNLHYERLDEHVTAGRPVVEALLHQQSARLAAAGGDALNAANAGLDLLHSLLMREALVLTFSDTFLAVALCFVVGLLSVAFSRPFGNTAPPPDAH